MKLRRYKSVRALLRSKRRWAQHNFALDSKGNSVPACSDSAVRFCLRGACMRVYGLAFDGEIRDRLEKLLPKNCHGMISYFNDSRSHARVLALVRKAKV
jgi:hypothetical protein